MLRQGCSCWCATLLGCLHDRLPCDSVCSLPLMVPVCWGNCVLHALPCRIAAPALFLPTIVSLVLAAHQTCHKLGFFCFFGVFVYLVFFPNPRQSEIPTFLCTTTTILNKHPVRQKPTNFGPVRPKSVPVCDCQPCAFQTPIVRTAAVAMGM